MLGVDKLRKFGSTSALAGSVTLVGKPSGAVPRITLPARIGVNVKPATVKLPEGVLPVWNALRVTIPTLLSMLTVVGLFVKPAPFPPVTFEELNTTRSLL